MTVTLASVPRFCWLCYQESVARAARALEDPLLAQALIRASREHLPRGVPFPSQAEHARHAGARPRGEAAA